MVKIACFDPYNGKFTNDMVEWWQNHGYEVSRETYYNPELVYNSDVVYFFTCDNNLLSATNPDQALKDEWKYSNRPGAWDMHEMDLSNKRVIVHPVDIEVWQGHFAYDNMWDIVDDVIFPAPHIQQIMMADSRPQQGHFKQHVIPFGVDLDKWTFKERKDGFKIGVVAERWVSKGVDYVIQIALKLQEIDQRYHIYWLGQNNDYHWQHEYLLDMIKRHNLPIILEEEFVDNLNQWWEDKSFVLSASMKETFGYNIAEAMAKGIKPLIHEFYGFRPIWGDSGYTWASIDECIDLITDTKYNSQEYLDYLIRKGYTVDGMMNRIEEVINAP